MHLSLLALALLALSMSANAKAMRSHLRETNVLQLFKTGRILGSNNQGYNNANYNNANNQNYNNWKNEYEGNYNADYNNGNKNNDGDDRNQVQGDGNDGYWDDDGEWVQYEDGDEETQEYGEEYVYGTGDLTDDETEEDTDDNLVHYKKLLEVHNMMEFYRLVTAILAVGLFFLSLYICYLRRLVVWKDTSLSLALAPQTSTPHMAPTRSNPIA